MRASEPAWHGSAVASPDGVRAATRIGRNFSFTLVTQVLSALMNVGGMVLLANYFTAEGYGTYAFYYALIPLIGTISDLGAGVIIVKQISRDKAEGARYFGDAILIKGTVSGVILLGATVSAWLLLEPDRAMLIWLVSATALIYFSQDVSIWIFRAHERLDLEALLLIISQAVRLGAIWFFIQLKASLLFMLGTATIAFLVRLGVGGMIVSRRMYRPVFSPALGRLRTLVTQAVPFGLAMFGVVLYGRIGILILKAFSTAADVAYFNIGYILSQPLGFISTALSMAAFPALTRYAQKGPEAIGAALRRTSKYQLVVTLPMIAGLFLLSERIIPLLLRGEGYSQAAFALKIMSLGLTLIFFNLMSRYVLAAMDRERTYLRAILAGLSVNTVLGAVLIPAYGFVGACVSYLLAELAIFVVCQWTLSRYVGVVDLLREGGRPLVAAACMGVVVYLMMGANLFLVVALGACTYFVMLLLLRAFSRDELRIMASVYASFHLPGSGYLAWVQNRQGKGEAVKPNGA